MGGFPFASSGFNDGEGYYFAQDTSGDLVIVDVWKRGGDHTNSNFVIMGNSGVGKSTGMINPLQVRPSSRDDEQEKDADRLYRDEGYGMNDLEIFFSLYIPSLTDMQKAVLKKCLAGLTPSYIFLFACE